MKKAVFILTISAILMIACGSKQQHDMHTEAEAISLFQNEPGDSALYGLACDGCTDSVLVFLPYAGGDPDTFDIIDAFQHRRIFGQPHIGDELVVILNPEDSAEAYMVFNTEDEYSLRLKRDNTVQVRGMQRRQTTTDDMSPVEYPAAKRYTEWHLYNGKLILKADTIAGFSQEGAKPETDTVEIEMLFRDSLVLRFPDHTQSYYRKKDEN